MTSSPRVELEPRNNTASFIHTCNGVENTQCLTCPGKPWTWDRAENTVTPRISCKACGLAGNWTKGKWKPE